MKCDQCLQEKEEHDGYCDDDSGIWYCTGCWETLEATDAAVELPRAEEPPNAPTDVTSASMMSSSNVQAVQPAASAFCNEQNPEIQLKLKSSHSDQEALIQSQAQPSQALEERKDAQAPMLSLASVVKKKMLSSTSRRATIIKQQWISKQQFVGSGLPLIVCLRCSNHFFVEKVDEIFTATARQRNLKYAFTLIPTSPYAMNEDIYQMVHIESARYLSVKRIGKYWALYPIDSDHLQALDPKDLSFCIVKISGDEEVNLRVTIAWQDKFLTIKDSDDTAASSQQKASPQRMMRISEGTSLKERMGQLSDFDDEFKDDNAPDAVGADAGDQGLPPLMEETRMLSLLALDGKDKMLIFDVPYTEHIDSQVFTLERYVLFTQMMPYTKLMIIFTLSASLRRRMTTTWTSCFCSIWSTSRGPTRSGCLSPRGTSTSRSTSSSSSTLSTCASTPTRLATRRTCMCGSSLCSTLLDMCRGLSSPPSKKGSSSIRTRSSESSFTSRTLSRPSTPSSSSTSTRSRCANLFLFLLLLFLNRRSFLCAALSTLRALVHLLI